VNIPTRIIPGTQAQEMDRMQDARSYGERAKRIVERVLPHLPTPNPLYGAEGFMAAAQRHSERDRLYWRTFARLRAKAEGGAPVLKLPRDSYALEGGAMAEVARDLLSDDQLKALSKDQRRFVRGGL
jgi:hypothetical protein